MLGLKSKREHETVSLREWVCGGTMGRNTLVRDGGRSLVLCNTGILTPTKITGSEVAYKGYRVFNVVL